MQIETRALLVGLKLASSLGNRIVEVESNCKVLIETLREGDFQNHPLRYMFEEVMQALKNFTDSTISYVKRESNKVAHTLIREIFVTKECKWLNNPPQSIIDVLVNDLII